MQACLSEQTRQGCQPLNDAYVQQLPYSAPSHQRVLQRNTSGATMLKHTLFWTAARTTRIKPAAPAAHTATTHVHCVMMTAAESCCSSKWDQNSHGARAQGAQLGAQVSYCGLRGRQIPSDVSRLSKIVPHTLVSSFRYASSPHVLILAQRSPTTGSITDRRHCSSGSGPSLEVDGFRHSRGVLEHVCNQ